MSEKPPRLGPDGQPAKDWTVNPKAQERRAREAVERSRLEAEAAAPWSRDKVARMLEDVRKRESIHVNGVDQPQSLNLHGVTLPDGIDLSSLDLSHANMHGVKVRGGKFVGSNMAHVNAHGAVFQECVFDDAESMESINLCQSCLKGSSFSGVKAEGSGGGVLGDEKWSKGLTSANLSESCCHGTVKGLDIQEHDLTTPLVDDVGRSLFQKLGAGETHVCQECGESFASIKARVEHAVREGHSKWSIKTDVKLGAQGIQEPAVMDTRLWLQMKGRHPILRGGKLRSTGSQLWRANVTGMLRSHKDRTSDPSKPKVSVSGLPEDFVL